MEPMTLGSPGNVSPSFMPGFLLGDLSSPSNKNTAAEAGNTSTSSQMPRRVSFAPDSISQQHSMSSYPTTPMNPAIRSRLAGTPQQGGAASPQKRGPPTKSLSDVTNTSFQNQSLISQHNASNQSFALNQSQLGNSSFNQSINTTHHMTADNNSFATPSFSSNNWEMNDENREAEHWVTVFGFPFTMVPTVLTWLASCGNIIVRHVPNSPKANWLHLRFNNPAEARRALGRHGSLLGMDTMIAVTPCTDSNIIQGWKQRSGATPGGINNSFSEAGGTYIYSMASACANTSTYGSPLNSSLRSLAASPDISVESTVLPRKSTGVVAKAVDYIFGW